MLILEFSDLQKEVSCQSVFNEKPIINVQGPVV